MKHGSATVRRSMSFVIFAWVMLFMLAATLSAPARAMAEPPKTPTLEKTIPLPAGGIDDRNFGIAYVASVSKDGTVSTVGSPRNPTRSLIVNAETEKVLPVDGKATVTYDGSKIFILGKNEAGYSRMTILYAVDFSTMKKVDFSSIQFNRHSYIQPSPDGGHFFVLEDDNLLLFDTDKHEATKSYRDVSDAVFSQDGTALYTIVTDANGKLTLSEHNATDGSLISSTPLSQFSLMGSISIEAEDDSKLLKIMGTGKNGRDLIGTFDTASKNLKIWNPDSHHLLNSSVKDNRALTQKSIGGPSSGVWALTLVDMDTNKELSSIPLPSSFESPTAIDTAVGMEVLYYLSTLGSALGSSSSRAYNTLFALNIKTGEQTQVPLARPGYVGDMWTSADGSRLFALTVDNDGSQLLVFDTHEGGGVAGAVTNNLPVIIAIALAVVLLIVIAVAIVFRVRKRRRLDAGHAAMGTSGTVSPTAAAPQQYMPQQYTSQPTYPQPGATQVGAYPQQALQQQSASAPKFCPSCGSPVPPGSAFCPTCGNRLR